jgi:magnesium transporter
MEETAVAKQGMPDAAFFLSRIIKSPVLSGKRKTGRLADLIIVDKDKVAEVTHIVVARPFGEQDLLIPWEKVRTVSSEGISVEIESAGPYAVQVPETAVLLRDYILDKKVIDCKDREVEVVYDVKLVLRNGKLYITEVDLSKNGLLRRIGLMWLADFIYSLASKIRSQTVAWSYVEPLPEQISSFKGDLKLKILKEELSDIPPVDLADILEELGHDQRMALFAQLDTERASDTLEELDPNIQRELIASLRKDKAAQLINEMTPGQAADLLAVLPWWEVNAITQLLNRENAVKIQGILEKQEEKIVDFSASNFLTFTAEKTVSQAREAFAREAVGKAAIMYLYILDDQQKLLGVIDIKELLLANEEVLLGDIMVTKVVALNPESTLKQASEIFTRYGFRALPLTDANGKMLGVVPYRDVMNLKHNFVV